MGSAIENIGVRQLLNGITWFSKTSQINLSNTSKANNLTLGTIFKTQFKNNSLYYWVKLNQNIQLPHKWIQDIFQVEVECWQSVNQAEAGQIVILSLNNIKANIGDFITDKGIVMNPMSLSFDTLLQSRVEVISIKNYELVKQLLNELLILTPL